MANIIKLNTILHPAQDQIHKSGARFKVCMLGGQFGKTELAVFDLIQAGLGTRNGEFWYVAPTYNMAKDIAWRRLKLSLPPQYIVGKPLEDALKINLISGSSIVLKGSDNPDSLRGVPLHGVILDETQHQKPDVYLDVFRLRVAKWNGFIHFYGTPNPLGRNWFDELSEEAKRRELNGEDWASFHFTSWDNPYLPREDLQNMKETMPSEQYNREIMGVQAEGGGLRFPEFKFDRNIGKYEGNNALALYLGADSGIAQTHPSTCVWVEADFNERMLYITDEYGKSGSLIKDFLGTVLKINGNRKPDCAVIDPSTTKRDKVTPTRELDEWNRVAATHGFRFIPGDNKRRGYDIVNTWLKSGRLKIHPKCKNLIYEFSHLTWEDKLSDDYTDSARYIITRINDCVYGMDMSKLRNEVLSDVKVNPNELTVDMVKKLSEDYKNSKERVYSNYDMNWVESEISLI